MQFKSSASTIGLAALCFAAPLSAEVVDQSPNGFVTRDSATVSASPQAVWLALISPGEWWNDAHTWSGDATNMTLEPQAGGCFCERIPPTEEDGSIGLAGSVRHMAVVHSFPRRVLRMRGGLGPLQSEPAEGVLTITMKATDDGEATQIVWNYVVGGYMRFEVPVMAKAVDGVMSQQLTGLTEKLGGAIGGRAASAAAVATDEPTLEPAADEPVGDAEANNEVAASDTVDDAADAPPKRAIDAADVLKALDALSSDKGD